MNGKNYTITSHIQVYQNIYMYAINVEKLKLLNYDKFQKN